MGPSFPSLKTTIVNITYESVGPMGGSASLDHAWLISVRLSNVSEIRWQVS